MGVKKLADRVYTWGDLEQFPEGEVWEIIEGVAYQMAPPSIRHELIVGELFRQFANYLVGKSCKVFSAPFGVYLPDTKGKKNFVSPDLTVVCDPLEGEKYYGVPALVAEVISPSNDQREQQKKFKLYQTLGIREYWVLYPESRTASIFRLNQNYRYELVQTYNVDEEEGEPVNAQIKVGIFDDLVIDFDRVFGE